MPLEYHQSWLDIDFYAKKYFFHLSFTCNCKFGTNGKLDFNKEITDWYFPICSLWLQICFFVFPLSPKLSKLPIIEYVMWLDSLFHNEPDTLLD